MSRGSRWGRIGAIAAVFIGFALFLYWFNHGHPVIYKENHNGVVFETAKVLEITDEDLEVDANVKGLYRGTQQLSIRVLTGPHKGDQYSVTNYLSTMYHIHAKEGMKLTVSIASTGDGNPEHDQVIVYNYNRAPMIYMFIGLFLALMWAIGGRKGLKSVLSLAFTFSSILFLFIPMLYRGYSPFASALIVVILTVSLTMLLLDGWSSKAMSAIVGTLLGVGIAGLISWIAGNVIHVSGFNTNETESLILISDETGMRVQGLLFAGILITSLGAIMDVGISIASSVYEVYLSNPLMSKNKLFQAGLNVGRDMMGTMANTLILAFTGASLTSLIVLYSYGITYNQLINMDLVAVEVIQGITGSIGVVLTVPLVAFVASRMIPLMDEKNENKTSEVAPTSAMTSVE